MLSRHVSDMWRVFFIGVIVFSNTHRARFLAQVCFSRGGLAQADGADCFHRGDGTLNKKCRSPPIPLVGNWGIGGPIENPVTIYVFRLFALQLIRFRVTANTVSRYS